MKKNQKISVKLMYAFFFVALLGAAAAILQASQGILNGQRYSDAIENYGFSQGYVAHSMQSLTDTRSYLRDMISSKDATILKSNEEKVLQARDTYQSYSALTEGTLSKDEELELLAVIRTNEAVYFAAQDKWIEKLKELTASQRESLRPQINADIDAKYTDLFDSYAQLLDMKVDLGRQRLDRLNETVTLTAVVGLAVIVLSLAVSVLLALRVSSSIAKPVTKLVDASKKIESGDLELQLQISSRDEIGQLGEAFLHMSEQFKSIISDMEHTLSQLANGDFTVASQNPEAYVGTFQNLLHSQETIKIKLSQTLTQINLTAEQVASGSRQVSDSAQALSMGASQQASSVEELAATITQVSQYIQDSEQYAKQASQQTNEASQNMAQCNVQMQEMVSAMHEISNASQEIGKIIKAIEDIAFQTNILALNAAVEAARAGAAGKGFAVVADEVRNLAAKSAEAAKNTTTLIEASIQAVGKGAAMADAAAQQLQNVTQNAQQASQMVDQIAQSAQEQTQVIHQLSLGIDQISSVVQNNSTTSEESAAASEELSAQATLLKDLVSQFQLAD